MIRGERHIVVMVVVVALLTDHADLRIRVEGHTDNVGNAESNKALSERRATAVREYLLATYGIDGGRVEAAGFGADQPAADNATPEGARRTAGSSS